MINGYILVGVGSAIGGMLRYFFSHMIDTYYCNFPFATLFINILGSFFMGFLAHLTIDHKMVFGIAISELMMVGLCGGFTTFSSFSLQTLYFIKEHEFFKAILNILLSVFLSIVSAFLGYITCNYYEKL